jgi:cyclic-di-GMP phosphodiesterase TipF (flagellum assembly factor)
MDVIVTKVEEEKDLLEILDYQFDYGQGYLFGKPRLNKG